MSNRQIVFESSIKINVPITRQSEYFIRSKDVNGISAPFDDVALLQEGAMTNRLKGHLYLPFLTERSGAECKRHNVTERKENFRSVPFGYRLPSVVFHKISVILSDPKRIFWLSWRSVPFRRRGKYKRPFNHH
uniref:Uncharacterized protein n=1 Tax=Romanomermis culicivorax TaxID=13658 RepID=A0A915L2A1_ROMCU